MDTEKSFMKRFKAEPIRHLIGILSIILGLLFFLMQTRKLFMPGAAEAEMVELPFGRFDWGYVWADTLVSGPMLLFGGFLMIWGGKRFQRLGQMFAFTGFTLNVYAMIFFWIGFIAIGETLPGAIYGAILWEDIIFVLLCLVSTIYLAVRVVKEARQVVPK